MPKIVDHDERRREIVRATWRVIRRIGVDATTVREIAKEAGYSNGVLAHYFTNKEELLILAHEQAFEQAELRMEEKSTGMVGLDHLRALLLEALPLDEERDLEAYIDVSFWAQSLVNARLRKVRTDSHIKARQNWKNNITSLREQGYITTPTPDDVLADELLMVIDALSAEALLFPEVITVDRQLVLVDSFMARLVAPATN